MNLEDLMSELNKSKPQSVIPEVSSLPEEQEEQEVQETKPEPVKDKKIKKNEKYESDGNSILKKVPSRRRVQCGICKKQLKAGEEGWYLACDKDEYWWCQKCIK